MAVTDPLDNTTTYQYNLIGQLVAATDALGNTTSYLYDAVGNLLWTTEPLTDDDVLSAYALGATTKYQYDSMDRVVKVTAPKPDDSEENLAPIITYEYDAIGNLVSLTDPEGNTTTYEYDGLWRLIKVTKPDPDGGGAQTSPVTEYEYDALGNLVTVTDPLDNETTYEYDNLGRLISVTQPDPDGGGAQTSPVTEYAYDAAGNLITVTDPLDNETTYQYDGLGRLVTVTEADPDGGGEQTSPVTEYEYDAVGNLVAVTDALDVETRYEYDDLGRLTKIIANYVDGVYNAAYPDEDVIAEYEYDAASNLVAVTDVLDVETRYEYDNLGRLTKTVANYVDGVYNATYPDEDVITEYGYDDDGNLITVADALSVETRYEYDDFGRLTKTIANYVDGVYNAAYPDEDVITEYEYDAASNLVAVTDALGVETRYEYDDIGQLTRTVANYVDGVYNGAYPDEDVITEYEYDAVENLIVVTDPLSNATTYDYDALGRLLTETDAEGGETSYTYDLNGNLLTLTDAEDNTTTYAYDALNRMISETNELDDSATFVYNAVGLLTRVIDREDRVIVYQYDDLYRNTTEIWYNNVTDADADQNRQNTISYTYYADSSLKSASDANATYEYVYNDIGRLIQETQTIAGLTSTIVFSSEYNANGQRMELSTTIGGTADFVNTYVYDDLGRLTQLTQDDQSGNTVAEKRVDLAYDAASRYTTILRYADLAGTDLVATATYTFDDAYRLIGLDYTKGVTSLVEYDWSYDAAGRMTQYVNSIDGTVDYTHDYTDQLTDADYDYQTDESYTYDDNGNRTNAGYVTGDNNQLLADGTYTYEYDDEGNRTLRYIDEDEDEVFDAGDTDATTYDWDHRNRLETVTHYDDYTDYAAEESDQSVDYTYDYANRLISRTLDPDGSSGATAIEQSVYVYEGTQVVAQFDKTGTGDLAATDLSHRYLWNPQAADQLFADEQVHYDGGFVTDELLWMLTDQLNSVRDLATYDSQQDETTVATHRVFDAFGKLTSSTGAAECLFGYTGKLFDEATQLQNNWNRWYDAAVGRWLSEDAIWDGTNLTRYIGNNPTTNVDPLGLSKEESQTTDSGYRTWTSKNEKYKIKAKVIGQEGSRIKLQKEDGTIIYVDKDQLSAADRSYLIDFANSRSSNARPDTKYGYRVWTDSTGKHKTWARIVQDNGDTVTIALNTGKQITVRKDQLSENDKIYLTDLKNAKAITHTRTWTNADKTTFKGQLVRVHGQVILRKEDGSYTDISQLSSDEQSLIFIEENISFQFNRGKINWSQEEKLAAKDRFIQTLFDLYDLGGLGTKLVTKLFRLPPQGATDRSIESGTVIKWRIIFDPDAKPMAGYSAAGVMGREHSMKLNPNFAEFGDIRALGSEGVGVTAVVVVGHELGHMLFGIPDPENVTVIENPIRALLGIPPRQTYDGRPVPSADDIRNSKVGSTNMSWFDIIEKRTR